MQTHRIYAWVYSNRPTAGAGWLTGDSPCEPSRRKPRAMAISPAPNDRATPPGN